jgi:GT2 family glycosyltransferase
MKISFIVCTYSKEFFSDTIKCIDSLINQDYQGSREIIVVMDRNEELYEMLVATVPKSVDIIINSQSGLSSARNTGIKNATGDIVVFIDDDAFAEKNYATNIIKNYEDANVIGTAGKILPNGKPNYPEEVYWIGGFTNKGYTEVKCEVRNAYGCNMSFRREVFDKVGLFNTNFGRVGKKLTTCDETEFSIKALGSIAGSKIVYDPSVVVYHKVHGYRQTFRYMVKRAYHEGMSKAHIDKLYKNKNGNNALSTENTYLNYLFAKAIPSRIESIIVGKNILNNTKDVVSIIIVVVGVGIGYISEKIK